MIVGVLVGRGVIVFAGVLVWVDVGVGVIVGVNVMVGDGEVVDVGVGVGLDVVRQPVVAVMTRTMNAIISSLAGIRVIANG